MYWVEEKRHRRVKDREQRETTVQRDKLSRKAIGDFIK